MADAKELLRLGRLSDAIQQGTLDVKAKPADVSARIFLFELLCCEGDLDRAEKQLDVISHQDAGMQVGAAIYRQILTAEKSRRGVFTEGRLPSFLTTPPEYIALYLEALSQIREKQPARARALLEQALGMQPGLAGQAEGKPFAEFGDSDPFVGPFLELIVNDNYAWLPYEQIQRIDFAKPAQLRDLLWTRAKVEARGGELGEVFLPVLYAGSNESADENIKLGRITDWADIGCGLTRGLGQRLFLIDGQERAMLEISKIDFATS